MTDSYSLHRPSLGGVTEERGPSLNKSCASNRTATTVASSGSSFRRSSDRIFVSTTNNASMNKTPASPRKNRVRQWMGQIASWGRRSSLNNAASTNKPTCCHGDLFDVDRPTEFRIHIQDLDTNGVVPSYSLALRRRGSCMGRVQTNQPTKQSGSVSKKTHEDRLDEELRSKYGNYSKMNHRKADNDGETSRNNQYGYECTYVELSNREMESPPNKAVRNKDVFASTILSTTRTNTKTRRASAVGRLQQQPDPENSYHMYLATQKSSMHGSRKPGQPKRSSRRRTTLPGAIHNYTISPTESTSSHDDCIEQKGDSVNKYSYHGSNIPQNSLNPAPKQLPLTGTRSTKNTKLLPEGRRQTSLRRTKSPRRRTSAVGRQQAEQLPRHSNSSQPPCLQPAPPLVSDMRTNQSTPPEADQARTQVRRQSAFGRLEGSQLAITPKQQGDSVPAAPQRRPSSEEPLKRRPQSRHLSYLDLLQPPKDLMPIVPTRCPSVASGQSSEKRRRGRRMSAVGRLEGGSNIAFNPKTNSPAYRSSVSPVRRSKTSV